MIRKVDFKVEVSSVKIVLTSAFLWFDNSSYSADFEMKTWGLGMTKEHCAVPKELKLEQQSGAGMRKTNLFI